MELPTDEVGIDLRANSGLFMTEDGSTSSGSSDAKLAIKLEDASLEFGPQGGVRVAGGATSNIQAELDQVEASVGLATDGTLAAFTGANYISADTTVRAAILTLDGVADDIQDELDASQASVGLGTDGSLAAFTGANYISADTTLRAAVVTLDGKAKNLQDELDAAETAVGLNADGTFAAWTGTSYLDSATTVKGGITALDLAADGIQDELDATQAAIGAVLSTAGAYVPHTGTNYINSNSTLTGDLLDLDAAIKANADAISNLGTGSITNLQTEVDKIEAAIGSAIDANGDYVAHTTSNFLGTNTSITQDLLDLDTQLKIASDTAAAAVPKASLNAQVFRFDSAIAAGGTGPGTLHTVTHNLNTAFVDVQVWVYDTTDSVYRNDLVGVTVTSANVVTLDLTEARDVRVIVRSAEVIS